MMSFFTFHERLWEAVASGRLHCQNSASGDKTYSNMTGMLLPTKEHVLYCERSFFCNCRLFSYTNGTFLGNVFANLQQQNHCRSILKVKRLTGLWS